VNTLDAYEGGVEEPLAEPGPGREAYERYMPLVRRIAIRTVRTLPSTISIDDLLSAGWIGMAESLARRTPSMDEEQFEAYASYRVRGAILDYLRSLDPLSRKLRGASRRITEVASELTARHGRAPTEDELSGELGIPLDEYHKLLTQISDAGLARLELSSADDVASADPSPEAMATRRELVDAVSTAISALPERLRQVLGLHYQEDCSFREIGAVFGVTESRACQLHTEAVHLIRAMLEGSPVRKGAISRARR
jgi:RNA polymerase sigma factor FliA